MFLEQSRVSNCTLTVAGPSDALGGAIYAKFATALAASVVTDSSAFSQGATAKGGGIFSPTVAVYFDPLPSRTYSGSIVSNNRAFSGVASATSAVGGGIYASRHFVALNSQISGNQSNVASAAFTAYGTVANSTVSSNLGEGSLVSTDRLSITDSTITNNKATAPAQQNGGAVFCVSGTIGNSILAKNLNADGSDGLDLLATGVDASQIAISTSLIMHANFKLSAGTLQINPKLGPLQLNGGRTMTHALLAGSPALNRGSSSAQHDQRGVPYERQFGSSVDIGAFEASDRIFYDGIQW